MRHTALFIAVATALVMPVAAIAEPDVVIAEEIEEEVDPPKPGLFGTAFLAGWTRNVGIGLSGSQGPTDELKLIADARGEYEDEKHRRRFSSQFYLSKVDSGTDRKAFIEYEENWKPFANKFYLLGIGRYDNDRLEAWDHRISASLGIGTKLYSNEKLELRASVGGGLNHVWKIDGTLKNPNKPKQTSPEGVVRFDGSYAILEDTNLSTTHTYYPNFDDTPNFRLISDVELRADIGKTGGLTASVGIMNEYDSLAFGENNDLTYYLRFGYNF